MAVTAREPRRQDQDEARADLSDLGTISESELDAARADAELQAESRAAREAVKALERDGRLITG